MAATGTKTARGKVVHSHALSTATSSAEELSLPDFAVEAAACEDWNRFREIEGRVPWEEAAEFERVARRKRVAPLLRATMRSLGVEEEWQHEIEWQDGTKNVYLDHTWEEMEARKEIIESLMDSPSAPARVTLSHRLILPWEMMEERNG